MNEMLFGAIIGTAIGFGLASILWAIVIYYTDKDAETTRSVARRKGNEQRRRI